MGMISEILYKIFGFSLPERAMGDVHLVDDIYSVIMLISIVGFFGLMAVMVFFVLRFHKSQNDKSAYIPHNALAETIWTVIPGILFVGIAVWGIWAFYEKEDAPKDSMIVKITGKQWMWEYTYSKNGQEFSTVNTLYLPINTPVILDMTSVDVIHSFFIPSFRTKRDVVPGMRSKIYVNPNKLGDFAVYCAEFCGTSHSKMRGTVRVVSKKRFDRWMDRQVKEANISDPVELGARLFNRKGCNSCHSLDGSRIIGPSLLGLWDKAREFEDGSKVIANADYIRESILMPNKKIVKGYPAKMNSFSGQLSEKQIDYLIEYIKTIK